MNRAVGRQDDTTNYVSLRDAVQAFENDPNAHIADVYAIVSDWNCPRKSKGTGVEEVPLRPNAFVRLQGPALTCPAPEGLVWTDYVANLYLCDESTEGWQGRETIELMLFGKNLYELPGLKSVGDIIRLQKVKVGGSQCMAMHACMAWHRANCLGKH
jgi:hypothetical protein